jgi:protein-disulfide isomerase
MALEHQMSTTRSQRGRAAPKKQSCSLRVLYMVVGAVVVLALVVFGVNALASRNQAEAPNGVLPPLTSSDIPTGVTAEGFNFKGSEDAPVTVTEYADFQCPGCGYFHNSVSAAFNQQYVASGQVKFVYHEYPLRGHANAVPAAEAARCAADQGAFWKMHDMLFLNQRQWSGLPNPQNQFATYAGQLGLDRAAFQQCLQSGTHREAVLAAQASGDTMQLSGTPSFAVNGQLVDTTGAGSVDDIVTMTRQAIEQALGGQ